jgi:Mg/Co/Ni transporter MgtE
MPMSISTGAPGGSWIHRQFFGPGTRLTSAAPAGAVIVRSQPLRAYQRMTPLEGLGRHLRAADARLVAHGPVHPVVDAGVLVGLVRDAALRSAGDDAEVGDLMEQVPYAGAFDALEELRGIEEFYDGAPVPIVDRRGRLIGGVRAEELDLMRRSPRLDSEQTPDD